MKYSLTVLEISGPSGTRSIAIKDGRCLRCKQPVPIEAAFDHTCPERIVPKGKRKTGGAA